MGFVDDQEDNFRVVDELRLEIFLKSLRGHKEDTICFVELLTFLLTIISCQLNYVI